MASVIGKQIMATKCDSYEAFSSGRCEGNERVVFGEELTKGAEGKFYFDIGAPDP